MLPGRSAETTVSNKTSGRQCQPFGQGGQDARRSEGRGQKERTAAEREQQLVLLEQREDPAVRHRLRLLAEEQ